MGPCGLADAQIRRVPAEWEPQEALWLQWPGPFKKTYEPVYAEIANIVVQYQPLHILYNSNTIKNPVRTAIAIAGGNPDHPQLTWHAIPNQNAWMRDGGPLYVIGRRSDAHPGLGLWRVAGAFGDFSPCE
jgi:agmatine deiminase